LSYLSFIDIMGKFDYKVLRSLIGAHPLDSNLAEFQTPFKKSRITPTQPEAGSTKVEESLTRHEEVPLNMEILSP